MHHQWLYLFVQLADAEAIATARSPRSSGQVANAPPISGEARFGGTPPQQVVTLSNLRDPQTSQTSLHLG